LCAVLILISRRNAACRVFRVQGRKNSGSLSEEMDFRITRDHRARDDHYNNHNSEFHIALTTPPSSSKRQRSAYVLWQRRQEH
jgi:hypothetical protein